MKIAFIFMISLGAMLLLRCSAGIDQEQKVEELIIPDYFRSIQLDSSYIFSIPNEFHEVSNLNFSSSFQFSKLIEAQYIVIQEEEKSGSEFENLTLNQYADKKLEDLQRKMRNQSISKEMEFRYGTVSGVKTHIEADVYGWPTRICYWISCIELEEKFVSTIVWTFLDRKSDFAEDAELIVQSVRKVEGNTIQ